MKYVARYTYTISTYVAIVIIIIYLICQSRLDGTNRHNLYKGASQKHKTKYKYIVHRDRYNNKTQMQQQNSYILDYNMIRYDMT